MIENRSRFAQIRKEIGWTQAEVAEKVGISREYLSMIESGKRRPSLQLIKRLADIYSVPVGWFYTMDGPKGTFQLLLRQTKNLSPDSRRAVQQFCVLCEEIAYLRSLLNVPFPELPAVYPVTTESIHEQARHAAMMERVRLGLGDDPVPNLVEILESKGIGVIHLNMPQNELSGAMAFDADKGMFILVNANDPAPRRLWTIAHEYGHLIKDRERGYALPELIQDSSELKNVNKNEKHSFYEYFAQMFAAHFLMPEETVRRIWSDMWHGHMNSRVLMHLRRTFGVSYQALLIRLRQLNLISKKEYEKWNGNRLAQLWKLEKILYAIDKSGVSDDEKSSHMPSHLLRNLALEAVRRGEISMSYCADLLDMPPMLIQDLVMQMEEVGFVM